VRWTPIEAKRFANSGETKTEGKLDP